MGAQANPVFECEYEASVLNQGPNQVHGTEMNRGLLATKNSLFVYAQGPNQVHGTETSTMNTMNRGLLVTNN